MSTMLQSGVWQAEEGRMPFVGREGNAGNHTAK